MKKKANKSPKPRAKADQIKNQPEELPGYPMYPSSEDIMNRGNRMNVDVSQVLEGNAAREVPPTPQVPNLGTSEQDSDLTKDDFQALASDEIESTGDDEILENRSWPVDFTGNELDVPGSEDDDAQEEIGSEDEENNSYSLGSDRHSDLDEGRS
jgi:hypothetical protein